MSAPAGKTHSLPASASSGELPDGWQAGLEARGLYEDQVLDVTTSLGVPATELVEGYGITVIPSLRKDLPAGLWLKFEVPVTRWYFDAPLDDYWEFGPVGTVGCDFGKRAGCHLKLRCLVSTAR
jgi:hypothetical protein